MTTTTPAMTGMFRDRDSAERAWRSIADRGYGREDVHVVMSDETRQREFGGHDPRETELGSKAAEGAGIGGAIGGSLGAIAAAIAAVGTSIALPGVGLVIAGPLAAAIAGAGAGAATGGIVGALIGWGIPEERVKDYDREIRDGGIALSVRTRNVEDASFFENAWKGDGKDDVYR